MIHFETKKGFFFGFLGLLPLMSLMISANSLAGIYDELNDSQKKAIQRGEQVLFAEEVGKPWPKVTVYQRISSTPEEAMAVMADYNLHSTFFNDLLKSKVSKQIDSRTALVDYTLDLPWPLGEENYTLKDQLDLVNNGATYVLKWSMVRADSSKDIQGGVRFEELGTGTVMAYQNLVVPDSGLAGMIKGKAIDAVKDAAKSLAKQIETEKASKPALLQKQIDALRSAL